MLVNKYFVLFPYLITIRRSDIVALNAVLAREASIYKWDNRRRINIDALAFLLSHTLYMRRFMPYYSFSVLASFAHDGTGKLYRYDCVGSFESVGCLCVGRGIDVSDIHE
jgi:20S proteasome alpha/beta subunit